MSIAFLSIFVFLIRMGNAMIEIDVNGSLGKSRFNYAWVNNGNYRVCYQIHTKKGRYT